MSAAIMQSAAFYDFGDLLLKVSVFLAKYFSVTRRFFTHTKKKLELKRSRVFLSRFN